jgi:hypothetical protein
VSDGPCHQFRLEVTMKPTASRLSSTGRRGISARLIRAALSTKFGLGSVSKLKD